MGRSIRPYQTLSSGIGANFRILLDWVEPQTTKFAQPSKSLGEFGLFWPVDATVEKLRNPYDSVGLVYSV